MDLCRAWAQVPPETKMIPPDVSPLPSQLSARAPIAHAGKVGAECCYLQGRLSGESPFSPALHSLPSVTITPDLSSPAPTVEVDRAASFPAFCGRPDDPTWRCPGVCPALSCVPYLHLLILSLGAHRVECIVGLPVSIQGAGPREPFPSPPFLPSL